MYESLADFDGQKVSQEERDAIIEALRLREEEAAEQNRIQVLQIGRGPKRFWAIFSFSASLTENEEVISDHPALQLLH